MFTTDVEAVAAEGADMFDELSIPYLLLVNEDTRQEMRKMYAAGYLGGFAAGQRDVVDTLDKLTTPTLPGNTAGGHNERQSR